MSPVCVTIDYDKQAEIDISTECADRRDVQHGKTGHVEALVLGHPYSFDPAAWVDATAVIKAYERRGSEFVKDLHGSFAVLIADRKDDRLLVAADRAGTYPVFMARGPSGLLFSDSIEALCARLKSVTLDRRALAEFLTLSYMLENRTYFDEIRTIRQATVLEVDRRRRLNESVYWRLTDFAQMPPLEPREVLDRFNDGMRAAFEMSGDAVVPVSGGLDSRAILSACLPFKDRIKCYTYGPARSRDVSVAETVYKKVGIPGRIISIDAGICRTLPQMSERLMSWSSGMVNFILFSHLPKIYERECLGAGVHMCGIGGEMLRLFFAPGGPETVHSNADILPAIEAMFYPATTEGLLAGLMADQPGMVRDSVKEALDATETDDPLLASECFYLSQRVSKSIAYSILPAARFSRQFNPFLHTPVLEAAPRLGGEMKKDSWVHRYMVDHNSPELASVVLASGKLATLRPPRLSTLFYYAWFQSRNTCRRALNKASEAVRGEPLVYQGPYNYGGLIARYLPQFVRDTLDPENMLLSGLVDVEMMREIMGRSLSGSNLAFKTTSNLMCAELWLKKVGSLTRLRV